LGEGVGDSKEGSRRAKGPGDLNWSACRFAAEYTEREGSAKRKIKEGHSNGVKHAFSMRR